MSDHNVVITDINIKAKICKKQPRNVYIYKNVDMDGLRNDLSQTFTDHLNDKTNYTVEENWNFFKTTILSSVKKYVPQKTISGKQNVLWINHTIKRLIGQRQRRYNAADIVKKTMTEAHDNYIRGILNSKDTPVNEQKKTYHG
jgi:disulfide oxidoreductase YuzD